MEQQYYTYEQALDAYVEASEDADSGIGTGYSLDRECGLMSTGELCLMWARSGCGKSSLLLNIINHTPEVPTVFFNMEMRARTMAEWLATMSGRLGVPYKVLKDIILAGPGGDPRYDDVMARLADVRHNGPQVWLCEPTTPSVDDLARTVDDITIATGIRPQRVMIDHLQLMEGCRADYDAILRTGGELHKWAQEDDLLVMCAQQTGRGGSGIEKNDGHIPVTLSSGVFGGEADADWILGAWRPEKDPKFRKSRADFKKADEYEAVQAEKRRVKGMTHLAVVKNRPFGTLLEDGITLWWDHETRQLEETGDGLGNRVRPAAGGSGRLRAVPGEGVGQGPRQSPPVPNAGRFGPAGRERG